MQNNFRPVHNHGEGRDKVVRVTLGWTVRGSNPDGSGIFRAYQTDPEVHPATSQCLPEISMCKMAGERCRAENANGLELYTRPSLYQHKNVMV